ncbi:ABC transporter ATP-binding protein [Alkalihalobacillus sp. LMS39]|uniref:ABC transporter ATP-binding protein n=1 Tax=Alkalihalobacillus sp. LMS39 TaxID=2924032 RepID=UPI001FB28002|nr:ABC transporter ATP-binding protein [Alkalihalobacillus sp. LMS39]UOE95663.1 ABC transporter ATP-binding protein [Alkalihalobacillus sp. LMS39]
MLVLNRISTYYGNIRALHEISLSVEKGELVVLLGSNGAGKSTLFQTISGLMKPSQGEIKFEERTIQGLAPNRLVQNGVVQCAEGRMLFPQMTVDENLKLGGYVIKKDKALLKKTLDDVYELFPDLVAKRKAQAGSLSGGQQQMVAIGRALMARPKLLMLDEPSLGLAPLIVEQMFTIIKEINKTGVTVLLAEQNAHAALSISSRGYVIESGEIVTSGSKDELMKNDEIRKAYIGA